MVRWREIYFLGSAQDTDCPNVHHHGHHSDAKLCLQRGCHSNMPIQLSPITFRARSQKLVAEATHLGRGWRLLKMRATTKSAWYTFARTLQEDPLIDSASSGAVQREGIREPHDGAQRGGRCARPSSAHPPSLARASCTHSVLSPPKSVTNTIYYSAGARCNGARCNHTPLRAARRAAQPAGPPDAPRPPGDSEDASNGGRSELESARWGGVSGAGRGGGGGGGGGAAGARVGAGGAGQGAQDGGAVRQAALRCPLRACSDETVQSLNFAVPPKSL